MTENHAEKLGLATLLYVRLRRNLSRVIDVVWLIQNEGYAREVLRLARSDSDPGVLELADKLEALLFGLGAEPDAADSAAEMLAERRSAARHYTGALR